MSQGLLLIDVLNLLHAANANKPLRVGELPTQGIYGFIRSLRLAVCSFPQLTPIALHDGRSWRHSAMEGYKGSRDAEPTTASAKKMAELRAQIAPQKPYVRTAMRMLGVRQIDTLNLEADDLAALMVRKAAKDDRRVMLLSGDKDWIQLVGPDVSWFDPMRDVRITHATLPKRLGLDKTKKRFAAFKTDQTGPDFVGVPSARAWLEIKALMGDSSDEIDGVGGIGDVGASEFIERFGSVANFIAMSIDGSLPRLPKKFAGLAESNEKQDIYCRNMMLMDLNHAAVPAPVDQRVDTGEFSEEAFGNLCRDLLFQSVLNGLPGWIEPFRRQAA